MKPFHKFPYEWSLASGYPAEGIQKHGKKVFGTFICGGGSTMGYKLAGYEHIGGVEIDPKVAETYQQNHHPKHLYVEDIRAFSAREDLPAELYELDVLDGSPPCSSFSMAGNREKDWGKEKVFKEGQSLQRLDDLFFDYIALAKKLQPKIVVAENVAGLIRGNAKSYVRKIRDEFEAANFDVQLFFLDASTMGVPQKRERVFFVCKRKDLKLEKLQLNFDEPPILVNDIIDRDDKGENLTDYQMSLWLNKTPKDKSFGDIIERLENRVSMFSNPIIHSNDVSPTITSSAGVNSLFEIPRKLNDKELRSISTFPTDYTIKSVALNWLVGMSVPPVMMAQLSHQIYVQWLSRL